MERFTENSAHNRGGRHSETPEATLAVADVLASTSGAHWANRDNDHQYRRNAGGAPFRRPPAENSFPSQGGIFSNIPVSPAVGDGGMSRPEVSAAPDGTSPYTSDGTSPYTSDGASPYTPYGAATTSAAAGNEAVEARYWTEVGEATRHPHTSDQPEATAPGASADSLAAPADAWVQSAEHAGARTAEAGARTAEAGVGTADSTVGSLLSGPGREIRPHRAGRRDGDTDPGHGATRTVPAQPRPRGFRWAVLATVLAVVGGVLVAGYNVAGGWTGLRSLTGELSDFGSDDYSHTATAPLDGRTKADFELVAGSTAVTMRSADLGDRLFRITTAGDSGILPRATVNDDRVKLHFLPGGAGSTGAVEIVLSAKVRWALRLSGGADEQRIDLRDGQLKSVDMTGGARRVELNLPTPNGTVPVRFSGAVEEVAIKAPRDNPVRLRLVSGAQTVAAGERTRRDVEPDATFTPADWKDTKNRYDVNAEAHVTLLAVAPTR